jgi:hypothetical protein
MSENAELILAKCLQLDDECRRKTEKLLEIRSMTNEKLKEKDLTRSQLSEFNETIHLLVKN